MMMWEMLHPQMTPEHLGLIPFMLYEDDEDSAVKQINKRYAHGGGWLDYNGFTMDDEGTLFGKGDPPLKPLARSQLRDELIYFYKYAWVAVKQKDNSFRLTRID